MITFGNEAVLSIKEFNKFITKNNYSTNLCTGEQALNIQIYINNVLKK